MRPAHGQPYLFGPLVGVPPLSASAPLRCMLNLGCPSPFSLLPESSSGLPLVPCCPPLASSRAFCAKVPFSTLDCALCQPSPFSPTSPPLCLPAPLPPCSPPAFACPCRPGSRSRAGWQPFGVESSRVLQSAGRLRPSHRAQPPSAPCRLRLPPTSLRARRQGRPPRCPNPTLTCRCSGAAAMRHKCAASKALFTTTWSSKCWS